MTNLWYNTPRKEGLLVPEETSRSLTIEQRKVKQRRVGNDGWHLQAQLVGADILSPQPGTAVRLPNAHICRPFRARILNPSQPGVYTPRLRTNDPSGVKNTLLKTS